MVGVILQWRLDMLTDKEILEDDETLDIADKFAKWADEPECHYRVGKLLTQKVSKPYRDYLELMGLA